MKPIILRAAVWCIVVGGLLPAVVGADFANTTPLEWENPAERHEPALARSEAERQRLQAMALYAAGRMLERKGDFPAALRRYERSVRYDPSRPATFERIITLSRSLNRHEETARYAYVMARHGHAQPIHLLLAAIYLKQTAQLNEALRLYEEALQQPAAPAKTAAWVELHKTAGEFYLRQQRYQDATRAFGHVERALKNPDDYQLTGDALKLVLGDEAALYRLFGEAYLLADQPIKAVAAFEHADRVSPGNGLLLYQLARVDRRIGAVDKAIAKIEKYMAHKYDTLGLAPYQFLEETLAEANRTDELIPRLQAAYDGDPQNDRLAFFLGEQLRQQGKLSRARRVLEQTTNVALTSNVLISLSQVLQAQQDSPALLQLLGDIAARTGSLDVLDEELAAIAADNKQVDTLLELANRSLSQKREAAEANEGQQSDKDDEPPFRIVDAAEMPPAEEFGVSLAAGMLAATAQRYAAAEKFFQAAIAADPQRRPQVLLGWGLTLLLADEYERSAAVFRQGTQAPTPPLARPTFYYYLSGSLAMLDKYDQALQAANQAVMLRSTSAEYQGRVAWILYRAGELEESAEAYRQLIDEYQDEFYAGEIREVVRNARLTLSTIYLRQDKLPLAIEMLEQVLDEFPDDVGTKNDLGYLWADNQMNLNMALDMIRDAVAADPENLAFQDSLGWALHRLGRHAEALPPLQKAAAAKEPDGVILDHLGDVLIALDRREEALDAWQRALEHFDEDETEAKQHTEAKIRRTKELAK